MNIAMDLKKRVGSAMEKSIMTDADGDIDLAGIMKQVLQKYGYDLKECISKDGSRKLYSYQNEKEKVYTFDMDIHDLYQYATNNDDHLCDRDVKSLREMIKGAEHLLNDLDDNVISVLSIRDHLKAILECHSMESAEELEAAINVIFMALDPVADKLNDILSDGYNPWRFRCINAGVL